MLRTPTTIIEKKDITLKRHVIEFHPNSIAYTDIQAEKNTEA
jgi:hypothetical protein